MRLAVSLAVMFAAALDFLLAAIGVWAVLAL